MAAISLNYKTYPYIALVIGYYAGSYLGAISAFLFVREYFQTDSKEVGYELALLKICSLLIKSDGNVDNNEIVFVKSFFNKTFGVSKSNKLFKQLKELDVPSSTSSLVEIICTVNPIFLTLSEVMGRIIVITFPAINLTS